MEQNPNPAIQYVPIQLSRPTVLITYRPLFEVEHVVVDSHNELLSRINLNKDKELVILAQPEQFQQHEKNTPVSEDITKKQATREDDLLLAESHKKAVLQPIEEHLDVLMERITQKVEEKVAQTKVNLELAKLTQLIRDCEEELERKRQIEKKNSTKKVRIEIKRLEKNVEELDLKRRKLENRGESCQPASEKVQLLCSIFSEHEASSS